MSMINIMLKNVDLHDKWWIELIKTISYFKNRSSMTNKTIIFYKIDMKRKSFLTHLRQIETTNYVMKRKLITRWKKFAFKSFSIVLVNYEENQIYRMLRLNEIIYRVSFVTWVKKKRVIDLIMFESVKRQIIEIIESFAKRQVNESKQSNFSIIIVFMSTSKIILNASSFSSNVATSSIESDFSISLIRSVSNFVIVSIFLIH
jgi:hypothetical protein